MKYRRIADQSDFDNYLGMSFLRMNVVIIWDYYTGKMWHTEPEVDRE